MKRIRWMLLVLLVSVTAVGCAGQADTPAGSNPFTDDFFADVVEIRDSRWGQVSEASMEPVVQYLKGLSLTATDELLRTTNENGEQLYGLDLMTFRKSDGTEITVLRNAATISGLNGCSYVAEGENLNSGLGEAFRQNGG